MIGCYNNLEKSILLTFLFGNLIPLPSQVRDPLGMFSVSQSVTYWRRKTMENSDATEVILNLLSQNRHLSGKGLLQDWKVTMLKWHWHTDPCLFSNGTEMLRVWTLHIRSVYFEGFEQNLAFQMPEVYQLWRRTNGELLRSKFRYIL